MEAWRLRDFTWEGGLPGDARFDFGTRWNLSFLSPLRASAHADKRLLLAEQSISLGLIFCFCDDPGVPGIHQIHQLLTDRGVVGFGFCLAALWGFASSEQQAG